MNAAAEHAYTDTIAMERLRRRRKRIGQPSCQNHAGIFHSLVAAVADKRSKATVRGTTRGMGSERSFMQTSACCEMHVSHASHMHEPGTDARIWTCDVWWAAHIGAAHICNIVWCICLSNTAPSR